MSETLSRVKEYLNLGILQMSRYGLNLKLEMCLWSDDLLTYVWPNWRSRCNRFIIRHVLCQLYVVRRVFSYVSFVCMTRYVGLMPCKIDMIHEEVSALIK